MNQIGGYTMRRYSIQLTQGSETLRNSKLTMIWSRYVVANGQLMLNISNNSRYTYIRFIVEGFKYNIGNYIQPRLGVVWAPRAPTDLALPTIYSSVRVNLNTRASIHEKFPSPLPSSTLAREGSESLLGTLLEREIITGGLYIAMSVPEVMLE
jgi:hypothetical protein